NVCFYGALVLFYQLLYRDFGQTVAKYALIYLAFAPYGLFFFAGYTESLFLLLSLGVFFFLRRGRVLDWWLSGLCGLLAAVTRATGIVLLLALLVIFVQKFFIRVKAINWGLTVDDKSLNTQSMNRNPSSLVGIATHCTCRWCILNAVLS